MAQKTKLTPKELVMQAHPTAVIDLGDGEASYDVASVLISPTTREELVHCSVCGHHHLHQVPRIEFIGRGNTEIEAWEDAARTLDLIK